ncbi:hypothetical protein BH24PSE2_BH24PSE2_21920 [soil metagenome]
MTCLSEMHRTPDVPTVTIFRPHHSETLLGPMYSVGSCITFIPEYSFLWVDGGLPCRSGDVCLVKDHEGRRSALMKQIVFDGSRWLVRTSYSSLPLGSRYEPLAPLVIMAVLPGSQPFFESELSKRAKDNMQEFLQALDARFPGQVRWQGDWIDSAVGNGPIWSPPGGSQGAQAPQALSTLSTLRCT